ncbi:hypothetical protein D9M72_499240 [compost metagenome]
MVQAINHNERTNLFFGIALARLGNQRTELFAALMQRVISKADAMQPAVAQLGADVIQEGFGFSPTNALGDPWHERQVAH